MLLTMGLEKVLHQDRFQLRDLLQDVDSIIKDLKHLLNDFIRSRGVTWDQLIWLENEVEDEERIRIFVFGVLRIQPLLNPHQLSEVLLLNILVREFFEITVLFGYWCLVEGIVDLVRVDNLSLLWAESEDKVNEFLD